MPESALLSVLSILGLLITGLTTAVSLLWKSTNKASAATTTALTRCEKDRVELLGKIEGLQTIIMKALTDKADANATAAADNSARMTAMGQRQNDLSASVDAIKTGEDTKASRESA